MEDISLYRKDGRKLLVQKRQEIMVGREDMGDIVRYKRDERYWLIKKRQEILIGIGMEDCDWYREN